MNEPTTANKKRRAERVSEHEIARAREREREADGVDVDER